MHNIVVTRQQVSCRVCAGWWGVDLGSQCRHILAQILLQYFSVVYFMHCVVVKFWQARSTLFLLLINFSPPLFPAEIDEDDYFLHQILQELYEVHKDSGWEFTDRALERLYKHWIFTLKFWHSTEYICLKSRQCSSVQMEFRLFFYYLCIYSFILHVAHLNVILRFKKQSFINEVRLTWKIAVQFSKRLAKMNPFKVNEQTQTHSDSLTHTHTHTHTFPLIRFNNPIVSVLAGSGC